MDFSVQLLPEQPLAELIDVVRLARRIRFGPEVSGIILRDPTLIAQQAATLDELTDGRAEIVFSIGNFAMLEQYGIGWRGTRPLARLREAHEVMRTFLAEGRIDYQGEFYQYSGLFTAARPVQQHLPLKIGAMTGPRSFRLAGEIADGVHVACAHSPHALSFAAQNVRDGAERTGRRLDASFDLCASVLGAISTDSAAAKEAARVAAAFYISSMAPELVERHGIDYANVRPVVEAFARGDVERALELTTPEIGDRLSIAGEPAEWVERLRRDFVPCGYDHVALGLVDPSLVESWSGRRIDGLEGLAGQLELFAAQVAPAMT